MASTTTNFVVAGDKTKAKQARKLLLTYVSTNLASTSETDAEWELQGAGVEDSAIEYNAEIETVHDILGVAETEVKYTEPTQEMDPHTIRTGEKLAAVLADIERRGATEEYSLFKVLVVHGYLEDTTGKHPAEVHNNCTIEVTSLGGDSYVAQPFTIHFSNDKTLGTADISNPSTPVFTKG